ncbi:MAG TPA: DNA polymerase III subunit delta' [Pyrinomonadaceae bacterium]|jgi:DNA polymerase-3 subunit delta'|nr:DNA polymerase III subunit delta' [Pyrinomonadaceae bacterium]
MPDRLIGNTEIKEFLGRIFASGRLPGALLFSGPEGVGKKQFALEIARSVLCAETETFGACGQCSVCKRAIKFVFPTSDKKDDYERIFISEHADVGQVIAFRRNILVDAIRALEREANFRPYEGKARFFIVDDADKMNVQAANALLKTLEEPPPTTHIFLITSRYNSLLATIISRCQVMRFQPIAETEIEKFLTATKEFSPEDALVAARISGGSLGRALQMNGEEFREHRMAMMEVVEARTAGRNRTALLRAAEEMGDARVKDDYEPRLEILQSLLRDVWQLKKGRAKDLLINTDLYDRLARCAENAAADDLTFFIAEIERVRENLLVNINRKIATDALFMSAAK